jgi:hypothetical protein
VVDVDLALAAELARMAAEDQRIRTPPSDPTEFVRFLSVAERMEAARVDVANTDQLRAIIAEHGWPGRMLVGDEGAEAAWLIAQHADHQLDFQREALALLERAVNDGDAPASHLAYLTDRVRMNEGRRSFSAPKSRTSLRALPRRGRSKTRNTSTSDERMQALSRSRTTSTTSQSASP